MDFLLRQTKAKPLYADLMWSRPENKNSAGKLLIIGGNSHGFGAPGEAFAAAEKAGAGVIKVLLPDNLRATVPKAMQENIYFLPSVKNGGFAKQSLAEMLDFAAWADGVLIAGDIGRNSETVITIESFIKKYSGLLAITGDALDSFVSQPNFLFERGNTLIAAAFGQLQKSWPKLGVEPKNISFSNGTLQLAEALHNLTSSVPALVITNFQQSYLVGYGSKVTQTPSEDEIWRTETAAKAIVWCVQNPSKLLEAATTSIIV